MNRIPKDKSLMPEKTFNKRIGTKIPFSYFFHNFHHLCLPVIFSVSSSLFYLEVEEEDERRQEENNDDESNKI